MKKLFAALLLSAIPSIAFAQAPDPAAGKKLWESNQLFCKNCHGQDGEGHVGPGGAQKRCRAAGFSHCGRGLDST